MKSRLILNLDLPVSQLLRAGSLLFILLVTGVSAQAGALKVSAKIATPAMKAALAEVEAKLPQEMKAALRGAYTVDLDSAKNTSDVCKEALNFDKLVRTDILVARRRILIQPALFKFLDSTQTCGSYSGQQLMVAALIHQLAHLYDQSNHYWDNKTDQKEITSCKNQYPKEKGKYTNPPSAICEYYLESNNKISDSLNYRSLSDYKGIRQESKNELYGRIGNVRELDSVHEHFALNLTQHLLDSSYACRRPALNSFFETTLKSKAFPEGSCEKNTMIYSSAGGWKFNIDPKKVYQVHFVFAAKGEEISSRWGHSMLRLVTCAPDRETVGPECLMDVAYHLILSYRANIDDVIINNWDGLTGKYPSQLMMFSNGEIVDEYTSGQWRELISLPIKFSEAQKDLFVQSVLEHYWSYSGSYKFLTNNCATEADQLIRAVLPKNHPYQNTGSITPLGVYTDLNRNKLIDISLVEDKEKARAAGYFYPSRKVALDAAFGKAKNLYGDYKDITELTTQSSAAERSEIYQQIESYEDIGKAYIVEKYIYGVVERAMQSVVSRSIQADRVTDVALGEAIDKLIASGQNRLPWKFATKGYGIPLAGELISNEEVAKRYREGSVKITEYREGLLQRHPEFTAELNAVKANLEILTNLKKKFN
ncbi:hypothetical protein D3C87_1093870 [compost metagenome]